jgi:hypothetical protein
VFFLNKDKFLIILSLYKNEGGVDSKFVIYNF